jgi:hypothetical protein
MKVSFINLLYVVDFCRLAGVERPILEHMVPFLDGFKQASLALEGAKTPTLHLTLPWFHKLIQHCGVDEDEDIAEMILIKQSAINLIGNKFTLHPLHRIASVLNPKMKNLKMIDERERNETYDDLRSRVAAVPIVVAASQPQETAGMYIIRINSETIFANSL